MKLSCDNCGAALNRRPSHVHDSNFCNNDCRMQFWRETIQPKMSASGRRVLAELHAEGRDPRHGEAQQKSRSGKVSKSNRENPRRARRGE